LHHG